MLKDFQGDSWGSIPPLRMSSLLPHDLCHGPSASLWPPTVNCSLPGSSIHGIILARIPEWIAISSPGGSSQFRDPTCSFCIAGGFFTTEPPEKPLKIIYSIKNRESGFAIRETSIQNYLFCHELSRHLWALFYYIKWESDRFFDILLWQVINSVVTGADK